MTFRTKKVLSRLSFIAQKVTPPQPCQSLPCQAPCMPSLFIRPLPHQFCLERDKKGTPSCYSSPWNSSDANQKIPLTSCLRPTFVCSLSHTRDSDSYPFFLPNQPLSQRGCRDGPPWPSIRATNFTLQLTASWHAAPPSLHQ